MTDNKLQFHSTIPCGFSNLCRCVGDSVRYIAYCTTVGKDLNFVLGRSCSRPDVETCFPCVVASFQKYQLRNDTRYASNEIKTTGFYLSPALKGYMYGSTVIDDDAGMNGAHSIRIAGFDCVLFSEKMSSFSSAPIRRYRRRAYLLFQPSSTPPGYVVD